MLGRVVGTAGSGNAVERERRIERLIREFDGQGWHRTGTNVDHASGTWLCERLGSTGVAASLETYPFRRLEPGVCSVEAGALKLDGLPMFDGPLTGANGVRGRLGAPDSGAEIALMPLAPGAAGELAAVRRSGEHRAIVVATKSERSGLAPLNAVSFVEPSAKARCSTWRRTAGRARWTWRRWGASRRQRRRS